jgi:hypothetical protein
MASDTLQKITRRAKQIRKGSKNMDWKTAVKKAGAEYRAGKIGKAKKAVKKKPTKYKSKLTGKWKPIKSSDNVKELRKYKYQLKGIGKKSATRVRTQTDTTVKKTIGSHKLKSGKIGNPVENVRREVAQINLLESAIVNNQTWLREAIRAKSRTGRVFHKKKIAEYRKALAIHKKNLTQLKKLL